MHGKHVYNTEEQKPSDQWKETNSKIKNPKNL